MKKILLALCLMPSMALAQINVAWEYSFKSKQWSPLVSHPITTLREVPILGTLDVSGLVGLQGGSGNVTTGFMLSRSYKAADNVDILLGFTARVVQSRPPQFGGVVIGITYKF